YLTSRRGGLDGLDAATIRGWFKGLPASAIEVILLERKNGDRLVALEIPRDRWPPWNELAGDAVSDELCWRIGARLIADDIGRVGNDRLNSDGSKYEYDIL